MAEITPVQVSSNGAVTFEKLEAPPLVKEVVKTGVKTCKPGGGCTDEVVLSRPLQSGRKKSYFTKPPAAQDVKYLDPEDFKTTT